jgi:type I restriction enzyme, S subunit
MRTVPLYELGEIVSGSTPKTGVPQFWDGDIPWITPADLSSHEGIYFHGTPKKISRTGFDSCSTAMLPAGSILFSSRAPIGHCALIAYPACTNQGFKNIVPNKRLDPVYGYFAVKFLTPAIVAMGRGATFAEINKELFETVQVPYCDLPEQRRIAGRLEQADRLVRTRRYALELTDTFLPAAFLQLFGDPVRNDKRWPTLQLLDACENITDGTHDTPDRVKSGVPFITSKNIRPFEIDLTDLDFVTQETHREIIKRCNPRYGDVLYTNICVNVGNAVANRLRFEFSLKNVALIQPDFTRLDSGFLESLMNNVRFKEDVLRVSSVGGAQKFVSLEVLRRIEIILPPLHLQQKFATQVKRVERLRAIQREALRHAEHLFASLLDCAFG